MLAACLDASDNPVEMAHRITQTLQQGMPALADEFELTFQRVWRGMGSISGLHVTVLSRYQHQPAPVPSAASASASGSKSQTATQQHRLQQQSPHEHIHNATRKDAAAPHHDHEHGHTTRSATVAHDHSHSHDNSNEHHHAHTHEHDHSTTTGGGPLRNLPEIRHMLQDTPAAQTHLPAWVRQQAVAAFEALAEAEAAVHGATSVNTVHFHEVGAIDSIVDMVGTLLALHFLQVQTVSCSPLPLGQGTVWTAHGLLPVPAPATLLLMKGMQTTPGPPDCRGELVTPTAAALLRVLTNNNNNNKHHEHNKNNNNNNKRNFITPQFTIQRVGVGAGSKDFVKHPNILRLIVGDNVKWGDHEIPS